MLLQPANAAWALTLLIDSMAVNPCTINHCVLRPVRLAQPLIDC